MKKFKLSLIVLMLFVAAMVSGCGSGGTGGEEQGQSGTLQFVANGEDFIRQGFTAKDGWEIAFDHVYVNVAEVTAYQADPPYDSEAGGEVQAKEKVSLPEVYTLDLAEGDENAAPISIGEDANAPVGYYNALSWKMLKAAQGPAQGYSLVIVGKAVKGDQTINFTIKDEEEYAYTGGEFIGDERKAVIKKGAAADTEMTFHMDHIFGDAGTPADDPLNTGAMGFEPFAAIAQDGTLDIDLAGLQEKLSPEDFTKFKELLPTLGHVGEGHCHCEVL